MLSKPNTPRESFTFGAVEKSKAKKSKVKMLGSCFPVSPKFTTAGKFTD
jgi:hypothetical protein